MQYAYESLVFAIHRERLARIAKLSSQAMRSDGLSLSDKIRNWLISWTKSANDAEKKWATTSAG